MFSGLVADLGTVEAVEAGRDGARLRVSTGLAGEIAAGDSVAVNGVCLTAIEADGAGFEAEAMNQTLALTSLGPLRAGDRVNLELALRASDRLGGHIVQGHVDGTAEVALGHRGRLRAPPQPRLDPRAAPLRGRARIGGARRRQPHGRRPRRGLVRGVADPGDAGADQPRRARPGTRINVECDVLAKYVSACCHHWREMTKVSAMTETQQSRRGTGESPFSTDRGGDRGDPAGPDDRRLRRRGPRERGRPGDGGAVRDAGGGQLHGQGGPRADLPGADRRSAASSSA